MRIDISCGADVAVTEPFLDVFQCNSVCVKQTGTTVSKVMVTNPPHPILFKEFQKLCCQALRLYQFPKFVHEKAVHAVLAVAVPAQPLIRSLPVLQGVSRFLKGSNNRQDF